MSTDLADMMSTPEGQEKAFSMQYSQNKGYWLGPFMIGLILNTVLFGVVSAQWITYVSHNRKERMLIRFLVHGSVIIAVSHWIYTISYMMKIFVFKFGSYTQFADLMALMPFAVVETSLTIVVQIFYADRAYRLLGNSKIFLAAVSLLIFAELACCLTMATYALVRVKSFLEIYLITGYLSAWLSTQVIVDAFITLSMTWALMKSKTGWVQTDRVITKLVAFTVETQLPPLIIAILFLSLFHTRQQSTLYVAVNFAMTMPYVIGMLTILNARGTMASEMQSGSSKYSYPLSSSKKTAVHITTQTFTQVDSSRSYNGGFGKLGGNDEESMGSQDLDLKAESDNSLRNDSRVRLT